MSWELDYVVHCQHTSCAPDKFQSLLVSEFRERIKECAEGIRESREGESHLRYESFDHLRVRVLMISIHVELIISESSPTKRAVNQAEIIDRDLLEW